jgi:general secretion pathway protein A
MGAQDIAFAFIFNSRLSTEQFFEMVAYDFALPCTRFTKTEVLFSLNNMLLDRARLGKTSVLIVDEAHLLEWDVLEEIRLLGNLENRRGKLLQVILCGQPELDAKLETPRLRQLKQRIALRYSLRPLTTDETGKYISFRLAHAGLVNQTIFPSETIRLIHRRTAGVPRLINLVCDQALLVAFAMSSRTVTPAMIDEVSADLRLDPVRSPANEAVAPTV